ncbi:hypothetical protein PVB08_22445 [Bacillus thuringiensis]
MNDMTQQDDITQRVPMAEQEAVRRALEAYAESYDMMARVAKREGRDASVGVHAVAYDIRRNMVNAVLRALSKLRAPVADERATLAWYAEQVAGCRKFGPDGDAARHALDKDGGERARAALASAPVAGEAKSPTDDELRDLAVKYDVSQDAMRRWHFRDVVPLLREALALYAAPQASAEYERGRADGWAAGWDQAIKQPQAHKDGGQQRAGDGKTREAVDYLRGGALNFDDAAPTSAEGIRSPSNACMHRNECRAMLDRQQRAGDVDERAAFEASGITQRLYRSTEPGYTDEYQDSHTQFAWRGWKARAALSATQAEQGERN